MTKLIRHDPMPVLVALVGASLGLAVAVAVALNERYDARFVTWGAAVGLGALTYFTLRRRTVVGTIMISAYLAIGVGAALFFYPTPAQFYGAAPFLAEFASATAGYKYLQLFVVIGLSLWLGFFMFAGSSRARVASGGSESQTHLRAPKVRISAGVLFLSLVPLFLDWYGVGFHTVLHASQYLQYSGPLIAKKVGTALSPMALLIIGNAVVSRPAPRIRIIATVITLGYVAYYLGVATRQFGLVVPCLYAGGLLTGKWGPRKRAAGLIVAAIAALLMIQVPLGLRALPQHGLVASVRYIRDDPGLLFASPVNNILLGAPLSLYVGQDIPPLGLHELVTALSPLPASLTDYPKLEPALRVDQFQPYSGLGELLNHGWWVLALAMVFLGSIYALLERWVRRSLVPGIGLIVVSAIATLAVFYSTQYNLRTFARLTEYATAIVAGLILVTNVARSDSAASEASSAAGPPTPSAPADGHPVSAVAATEDHQAARDRRRARIGPV